MPTSEQCAFVYWDIEDECHIVGPLCGCEKAKAPYGGGAAACGGVCDYWALRGRKDHRILKATDADYDREEESKMPANDNRVCPSCGGAMTTGGCLNGNCPSNPLLWPYRVPPAPHILYSSPRTPHKCPVCAGAGLVTRPPGVAGDQETWTGGEAGPFPCRACGGTGIVWG